MLTTNELEQGRQFLEQSREGVVTATAGLSEAQYNFKPASDRWSISEILEHMLIVQEAVLGPIRETLATAPKSESHDPHSIDSIVLTQFTNRSQRFNGPERIHPAGNLPFAAALDRVLSNHGRLLAYLESAPDLREHTIESLPLKAVSKGEHASMDGYQWILAAAAHTQRHTLQILEVKSDPAYPA